MSHHPPLARRRSHPGAQRVREGTIQLSAAEAEYLRAAEFSTAAEGEWALPPFPSDLLRQHPHLAGVSQACPTLTGHGR